MQVDNILENLHLIKIISQSTDCITNKLSKKNNLLTVFLFLTISISKDRYFITLSLLNLVFVARVQP